MSSPKKKGGAPNESQSRTDWVKGSTGESKSPMMVDGEFTPQCTVDTL